MTRRSLVSFAAALVLLPSFAEAGEISAGDGKNIAKELKAAYGGKDIWALKDLPVKTGFTMYAAWIAPLTTVTPSGFTIDASAGFQATVGSATSVWYGVRPYDKLQFKEADVDDGEVVIALVGKDGSKSRDTKIALTAGTKLADVQAVLDELITTTDPAHADWPADVKTAIANRKLVNGMSKRQAYLVVGEPIEATTKEEGGKKVETWKPRQQGGMRIGYGASTEMTGYPSEIHFEDGKLSGMAKGSGGGVSLD